jgi:hypothetical protein
MNLTVSYNHLYHNWYVGEFYVKFTEHLRSIPGVNVNYVHLSEFSKKYNCNSEYNNGFPSVFSPFNLIIINEDTGKTFIHSWHDYAPAILINGSGIENFDVVMFSCVSRLDQSIIEEHSNKFIVQPSIYYLENMNDFDFIEKYRTNPKTIDKVYMNASCHGLRERYIDVFNKSEKFNLKKKDKGEFLPKDKYYDEMSQYKFGLNLDGAAKICYRDLESFGLSQLLLRENLNVLTYEPLKSGKHYLEIIDDEIKLKINNDSEMPYIIEKIESKIHEIVSNGQYEFIVSESRGWYERNCLPNNQINILYSFLEDLELLK